MLRRQERVAFERVLAMRRCKGTGVDRRLGCPNAALAFESGDLPAQVGVHEPEAGRHRTTIVEQRCVGDHDRTTVVADDRDVECALRRAPEQLSDSLRLSGRG